MPKKERGDDEIFKRAKNKLDTLIAKSEDAKEVMGLVSTLVKMKAVELKMGEDDWGAGLTTPGDEASE